LIVALPASPVVTHLNVVHCPLIIAEESKEKVTFGGIYTVNVAVLVVVPPNPVAVIVYMVVVVGEIDLESEAATEPMP
jgi:hypothetical protein